MRETRPTPFGHLFAGLAESRFPALRDAMTEERIDPRNRDGFLLVRPVVELLRDLRPDEGLGEAIDAWVALVHSAYLYWANGSVIDEVTVERLRGAIDKPADGVIGVDLETYYLLLPPRVVWGVPFGDQPAEPMDGAFISREGEILRAVAVFGFHPDRLGLTVVEVQGPQPGPLERPDGSPLFGSTLAGGAKAGLLSLAGMEELLALCWRLHRAGERSGEP